MTQKLPVNNCEWIEDTSQFNEDFIKNYNEERNEGYFLEVDIQYLEKLYELHKKLESLVTNIYNKTEFVIHIGNLKQALNHRLILKKVHGVIKCYQNSWLKPYINMNAKLREKAKNNFEKDFSS